MTNQSIAVGSLVLYKIRPALVREMGEKIAIELDQGQSKRVRPKDIQLLHPGPVAQLADIFHIRTPDLEETRELLDGATTDLAELAGLLFGDFTPASAWATWELVLEGHYFEGSIDAIRPRSAETIAQEQAERAAKAQAERDWGEFLSRIEQAALLPEDSPRLIEVERLAYQQAEQCRLLRTLGYEETPASAHRFLLQVGHWPPTAHPYLQRFGVASSVPDGVLPPLVSEDRLDLTHLAAWAIDDEGNTDPDDALSIDGERIWVHVADVAALVAADDAIDQEARARGANLYLPEGVIPMLPPAATTALGLGLQPLSPALSFGFCCDANGELSEIEVQRTLIRVTRISYAQAQSQLEQPPLQPLWAAAQRFRAYRLAHQATTLQFPEVNLRVVDGQVQLQSLDLLASRTLVSEAMLMAGTAAARWCQSNQLAIPYAVQPAPERVEQPQSLAAMYAYRRQLKPSRSSVEPGAHAGLGLDIYTRVTSPLRRYADLLVHQQLRAQLGTATALTEQQISERASVAEIAAGLARRTERNVNQHWKLVYLQQHPNWQGEAVIVAQEERRTVAIVPELALEIRLRAKKELALDQVVTVRVAEINLPELECRFRVC